MARKPKTNGETSKSDPGSAGGDAEIKAAEGIRSAPAESKSGDDVAAPDSIPDSGKSNPPPAAKKVAATAAPDTGKAAPGTKPDPMKVPSKPESPGPGTTGIQASTKATNTSKADLAKDSLGSTEPTGSTPAGQPGRTGSQTATSTPPASLPDSHPETRRSIWPMLFAGIFTTAIGFGAAYYLFGDNGPLGGTRLTEAEARLTALEAQLADANAAQTRTDAELAKAAPLATTAALDARLAEAEAELEALKKSDAEAIAALTAKLDDLRQRPAATDPAATAAYERELAAMREMLDAELAKIRTAAAQAAAAQTAAAVASTDAETLAALSTVETALDSGGSFVEPLDQIAALHPSSAIDDLREYATGVEPLSALQRDFPDAARAAIDADNAAGNSATGLGGFLKSQLGMRSLAPKEGDSVDAVLSRAEAKLHSGDLAGAMVEIATLAGPAADALAPWRSRADRRLAALAAFAKLSNEVRN